MPVCSLTDKDKHLQPQKSIHSGKSEWAGDMLGFSMEGKYCCYGNQMIVFSDRSPSALARLPDSAHLCCGDRKLPAFLSRECSDAGLLSFPASGSKFLGRGQVTYNLPTLVLPPAVDESNITECDGSQ